MASNISRRPDETAKDCPPELACLAGAAGPYIKSDRAEFHHCRPEVQEWLMRMDSEELSLQRGAAAAEKRRLWRIKWGKRAFYGATGGFAAVYAAGKNAYAFAHAIGQIWSDPSSFVTVLSGLFGS